MAIYIKGMAMPKNCEECSFCVPALYEEVFVCLAYHPTEDERVTYDGTKPNFCPLTEVPEPHGRLIDGDLLFSKTDTSRRENNHRNKEDASFHEFEHRHFMYLVLNTPTVIEGSER